MWALAVVAVMFLAPQVIAVGLGPSEVQNYAVVFSVASAIAATLVPLTLGILAMMLGARGLPAAPTQVYPPAA